MPCQRIFQKCYIWYLRKCSSSEWAQLFLILNRNYTIYSMEIDILRLWRGLWRRHFNANFDVHLWGLLPNVARLLTLFWDVRYHTKTKLVPSTKVNLWIKRACAKLIVIYMCANLNERRQTSARGRLHANYLCAETQRTMGSMWA
jgi:hypothetical protein